MITSAAPIKEVERKILLVPIIFMIMCSASFACDLYFYINHGGLSAGKRNNAGIIFVHFLIVRSLGTLCDHILENHNILLGTYKICGKTQLKISEC